MLCLDTADKESVIVSYRQKWTVVVAVAVVLSRRNRIRMMIIHTPHARIVRQERLFVTHDGFPHMPYPDGSIFADTECHV